MSDPIGPVSSGDKFRLSETAWNPVFEAARAHRERSPQEARPRQVAAPPSVLTAWVVNDTGANLLPHKVVSLDGLAGAMLPDDALNWQRRPQFSAIAPVSADSFIAVTIDGILDGGVGRVAISGAVVAYVEVNSTSHDWATPVAGVTDYLTSGDSGPIRILHIPSASGLIKPCVVFLGEQVAADTADRLIASCHIVDDYTGFVTGTRETWVKPNGDSYCRLVPTCTDGTCNVLWWCDGEGGVFSAPVGERPADAVTGPWATEDMAVAECEEWLLTSGQGANDADCTAPCSFEAKRTYQVSIENATGVLLNSVSNIVVTLGSTFWRYYQVTGGTPNEFLTTIPTGSALAPFVSYTFNAILYCSSGGTPAPFADVTPLSPNVGYGFNYSNLAAGWTNTGLAFRQTNSCGAKFFESRFKLFHFQFFDTAAPGTILGEADLYIQ